MVSLDGIRRVYYLSNLLRIFKKYSKLSPVFIPGFQNIRVLLIPLLTEFLFRKFGVIKVHSTIDFLPISAYCLTILVRYELAAVSNLVNYAELIFRLWKNRVYRIAEPCEVIVTGNENIPDSTTFQVGTNACFVTILLSLRELNTIPSKKTTG